MRRHSILAVLPGPLTSVLTSVLGHTVGDPFARISGRSEHGTHVSAETFKQESSPWEPCMMDRALLHSATVLFTEASGDPLAYWIAGFPVAASLTEAYQTMIPPRSWSRAALARVSMSPATASPPQPRMTGAGRHVRCDGKALPLRGGVHVVPHVLQGIRARITP